MNRCGSNQAWELLEKLNSSVINQSYVLTGGGKHFYTQGHVGLDLVFPSFKTAYCAKTAYCVYLCYL